ncbi:MAG: hypothetical protein II381_12535, partial [Victivallales bacterium]|nr:hypothetical protein [Victivallales bacterium]
MIIFQCVLTSNGTHPVTHNPPTAGRRRYLLNMKTIITFILIGSLAILTAADLPQGNKPTI